MACSPVTCGSEMVTFLLIWLDCSDTSDWLWSTDADGPYSVPSLTRRSGLCSCRASQLHRWVLMVRTPHRVLLDVQVCAVVEHQWHLHRLRSCEFGHAVPGQCRAARRSHGAGLGQSPLATPDRALLAASAAPQQNWVTLGRRREQMCRAQLPARRRSPADAV